MIDAGEIAAALREAGVRPGDAAYVHSGLRATLAARGRSREEKVGTIVEGFAGALDGGTLMMPTYTYSFTKGQDFDVDATPSTVGALTEAFRHLPGVRRTPEPLFSSAVLGEAPDHLFAVGDVICFGERSIFAHLHAVDAKLVLFGVGFEFCTYVYLVEQRLQVPYRYLKAFSGRVVAGDRDTPVTAHYYVRRLDEDVENDFGPLAAELLARGHAREVRVGDGPVVFVAGARAVHDVATERVRAHPDFLLTRGHRS